MRPRALVLSVVATLLATAGALGLTSAPAHAALCSGTSGVSVVVDYRSLGGSTIQACDPSGGGQIAHGTFARAGVVQQDARREYGFICKVNRKPSNDPCINASPANAYWALWWSDGDRDWVYSNLGVRSLRVPEGGIVAWSFQNGGANVPPGVSPRRTSNAQPAQPKPTKQAAKPKPARPSAPQPARPSAPSSVPATSQPTQSSGESAGRPSSGTDPTPAATKGPGNASAGRRGEGAGPSPSARGRDGAGERPRARPARAAASESASPGDQAAGAGSSGATPSADQQAEAGSPAPAAVLSEQPDGLPWWVPAGVLAGLAASGAGTAWWRRRTT